MKIAVDIDEVLFSTKECEDYYLKAKREVILHKAKAEIFKDHIFINEKYYDEENSNKGKKFLANIGYYNINVPENALCNLLFVDFGIVNALKEIKKQYGDVEFYILTSRTAGLEDFIDTLSNTKKRKYFQVRKNIIDTFCPLIDAKRAIFSAQKGAAMVANDLDILIDDNYEFIEQAEKVNKIALWKVQTPPQSIYQFRNGQELKQKIETIIKEKSYLY